MSSRPLVSSQTGPASRTRYGVIYFAVTLAILSYIDRVCISQAAPIISQELGFTKTQMGQIFAAFAIAYAVFEIPGGWMGDWMGARKVLMRIVIWWSAFTALTGAMWSFASMWITRFLFGAGEAGCFPNLTKSFTTWLPRHERVKAQGIMWMSARWGGAVTPWIVIFTLQYVSWRWAFVIYGILGLFWAVAFYRWYRDDPKDHRGVNAGELALIGDARESASGHGNVPWGRLVSSRSVWLLWAQYFFLSYPWYFYITWLPTYLKENQWNANLAFMPLFFGGLGSLFCGFISPKVVQWTGGVRTARRVLACAGFLGAAIMLTLSIQMTEAIYAMLFMGLASFCNDLVMPGAWGACMDVGGRYAGTVSGSMNMMGNLAGFVAPWVGGKILDSTGNDWNIVLYTMAGMYLAGTFCWPFIDPVTPLEDR